MDNERALPASRQGLRFSDIADAALASKRKSRIMLKANSGGFLKSGGQADDDDDDDDESSSDSSGGCEELEQDPTAHGWATPRKGSDWRGMMSRLHKADLITSAPTKAFGGKKSFDKAVERLIVETERSPRPDGCPTGISEDAYKSLRAVFAQLSGGLAQLDADHVTRFLRSGGAFGVDSHVVRRVMSDLHAGRLSDDDLPEQTPDSISADEFVRATSFIIDECDPKEDLSELWRLLGPGTADDFDPERWRKGLAKFGHNMTEEEAADFFAFEVDRGETLDYTKFVEFIVSHCSAGREKRPRQET